MNNKFKNALALGGFIIFAIIVAVIVSKEEKADIVQDTTDDYVVETVDNYIVVYIIGAVHEPGVIRIKEGSRMYEVVEAAGGATDDANIELVNLASIVKDEQKVIIPYIESGDNINMAMERINSLMSNNKGLVNINTATQTELQSLTGIGESTAMKIINYRNQNGYFENVEELMNVSGIGKSKFNAIKNDITVWYFGGIGLNINEIIKKKRDQKELSKEEIDFFVDGYSKGDIPDYQASSLLMAIYLNGMSENEIYNLTMAMAYSGEIVDLSEIPGIKVDKHSTGGIGDKVTMVVMPLVAACGVPVAKMSGRGLGYTQGTIDKLDSIPNFRTDIEMDEFIRNVKRIGIALMGQSEKIAIADKKLYALRDVTGTVESIPLIASSIMSKKIAAGSDKILLEVTAGSGAFMDNEVRARVLANTMVKIGKIAGKETIAVITNMDQPLGKYCGNALETMEAIETLKGHGEEDVVKVCSILGAYMLKLAGVDDSIVNNIKTIQSKIDSGEGLEKFRQLISRQWGDSSVIDAPEQLRKAKYRIPLNSMKQGYISKIEAKNIGQAVVNLGGGRYKKDDVVNYNVGIEMNKKIGDLVKVDEPLLYIHADNETNGLMQVEFLRNSFEYSDESVSRPKEILDIVE